MGARTFFQDQLFLPGISWKIRDHPCYAKIRESYSSLHLRPLIHLARDRFWLFSSKIQRLAKLSCHDELPNTKEGPAQWLPDLCMRGRRQTFLWSCLDIARFLGACTAHEVVLLFLKPSAKHIMRPSISALLCIVVELTRRILARLVGICGFYSIQWVIKTNPSKKPLETCSNKRYHLVY